MKLGKYPLLKNPVEPPFKCTCFHLRNSSKTMLMSRWHPCVFSPRDFIFIFVPRAAILLASATIKGSGWIRTDRLCFADFCLSGLPQKTITATNYNKHGSYCPSNLYNYSGTSFRALSIGGAGQMYRISGEENVTACFLRSTGLRHPSLSTSLGVPSTLIRLAFLENASI